MTYGLIEDQLIDNSKALGSLRGAVQIALWDLEDGNTERAITRLRNAIAEREKAMPVLCERSCA